MNKEIYTTTNFTILAPSIPHVSREEGGHIVISPKVDLIDRTELSSSLAIELMRLTMVAGEAMKSGLGRQGVDIGRINYQDNGNWGIGTEKGPRLHIHLYGRAKTATIQKYGEALHLPRPSTNFYEHFRVLEDEDIATIKEEIEKLLDTEKYQDKNWNL